ncbi:MAG: type I methionyl aminopeptidase [Deltaproteobacteria bacterium CG11_big_fil_rev_8_21_14_0_20_49_13]|nr:MAG: type I methionyl aminopeptidase [Deltaproteobacteria bacterium CG11_big_fil_rev_8_21_14_0_20_49_13]
MIILKSREEIEKMNSANKIVAEALDVISEEIKEGVTTGDLDRIAEELILKRGGKAAFKGYRGYKHTLCTSINQEIVHGIPGKRAIKTGDIIGVDCGVLYKGFYGDMARTFPVGEITDAAKKLLRITKEALNIGTGEAKVGNRLFDISAAVQKYVEANGFSVVRDFVGHGVGASLHEDPQVPNFGEAGTGVKLRPGMVLALEPMVNSGGYKVKVLDDGWTVVTQDGGLSAHFEHSVAITENGPLVLGK